MTKIDEPRAFLLSLYDPAGQRAAQRIAQLARGLTVHDLLLCLVSGGGSALLTLPAPGLTLADKQAIDKALLASGAAIGEMNCVRKHLSAIKGGRRTAMCALARVVTMLIGDVPGDAPEVIASGPTVADASTCADAPDILRRYGIERPAAAGAGLESGAFETPKAGDAVFAGHEVHLIATPQQSLEALPPWRARQAWPRTSSATRWKVRADRSARRTRRWPAPWPGAESRFRGLASCSRAARPL